MKEKAKKNYRSSVLSRNPFKRRKESELLEILKEVSSGRIAKRAACVKYGLNRNTFARFIKQYSVRTLGKELSNELLANMTDDQKSKTLEKKVKDLTKALEHARLKNDSLQTMIKAAEESLHIKIRKKPGTKQS